MANLCRLTLCVLWVLAWGTARWIFRKPAGWSYSRAWLISAFQWGSRESPAPWRCVDCRWVGPLRWAVHTYEGYNDDIEGVDYCPHCRADALRPFARSTWWRRRWERGETTFAVHAYQGSLDPDTARAFSGISLAVALGACLWVLIIWAVLR